MFPRGRQRSFSYHSSIRETFAIVPATLNDAHLCQQLRRTERLAIRSRPAPRELSHYLAEHELADDPTHEALAALAHRLAGEKLVVAFVAEFSRGKSELINAIFFADAGKRVLPATPGRTTMCPVELAYDPEEPPTLSLLPIETRLEGLSLGELRTQPRAWEHVRSTSRSPRSCRRR
jgi:hypothetical protein